jgi:hypothetical protein
LLKNIFSKQLTSTKLNDILIFVANEANENDCSLKTKQSRNVNVNLVTICNKNSCLRTTNFYELFKHFIGEFDPGSGRTLAACLIHASRANLRELAPKD